MEKNYDFIVVGSGIAGLFYSLKVAELEPSARIAIVTKKWPYSPCRVTATRLLNLDYVSSIVSKHLCTIGASNIPSQIQDPDIR